jgi:hypothetical protein
MEASSPQIARRYRRKRRRCRRRAVDSANLAASVAELTESKTFVGVDVCV